MESTSTDSCLATARPLGLVSEKLQPILTGSRAVKDTAPFVRRLFNIRMGQPETKLVVTAAGSFCDTYVEGDFGTCLAGKETIRAVTELGKRRFWKYWNHAVELGLIESKRRQAGLPARVTVRTAVRPREAPEAGPEPVQGSLLSKPQSSPPGVTSRSHPRGLHLEVTTGGDTTDQGTFSSSSKSLPTDRQLRGIADTGQELRAAGLNPAGSDSPQTRLEASETFRERKRQVTELRADRQTRTRRGDYTPRMARQNARLARDEALDDWQPATDPDADQDAVVDWRCCVEQSLKRGNLEVERRHFIAEGETAGVTDPAGEIDWLIARCFGRD